MILPNRFAQFDGDYEHDFSLAETARMQVMDRIDAGEDLASAVVEIAANTVRAYFGPPWIFWHVTLQRFLTHGDTMFLADIERRE